MSDTGHEASYRGVLYVRPIGRGILLEDHEARPYIDEWLEQVLHDAGVLANDDAWLTGGRTTAPITLTVRIERRA